ncbi:2-Oxoglutarate And Iron-Dependent Oxygenase Jmjd4 [Manis pentadactyla]|nr:2-Oxoglutarate And Iron-Dependent Oxygenase Jmjd4 [Manis pentadactyla]
MVTLHHGTPGSPGFSSLCFRLTVFQAKMRRKHLSHPGACSAARVFRRGLMPNVSPCSSGLSYISLGHLPGALQGLEKYEKD